MMSNVTYFFYFTLTVLRQASLPSYDGYLQLAS